MSLWGGARSLWGASGAAAEVWTTLLSIDYTAVDSADWSGNGTFAVGGVDHVVTGGGLTTTLGPDGSTGIRIVQGSTGGAPTGPAVRLALADIAGAVTDGDDLLIDVLYSLHATPGNFGSLAAGITEGSDYLIAGPVYQTVPGQWEWRLFYTQNNDTDDGIALSATSGACMTLRVGSKYLAFFDRGAHGSFPGAPSPGAQDNQIGSPIGANETGTTPALTAADLYIGTGKSIAAGDVDITIHGLRVRRRGTS